MQVSTKSNENVWEQVAKTVPGFIAGGLFDGEGLIIDGESRDPNFHLEHAAASFVTIVLEADSAGSLMGVGESQQVQLEYGSVVILMRSVSNADKKLVIGLAVRKGTPIGRIRMGMDYVASRLR